MKTRAIAKDRFTDRGYAETKARAVHLKPFMGRGFGRDAVNAAMNARSVYLWPVIRHVRRWYWRRRFAALDRFAQGYARFLGIDPDSLIERGEL